MRLASQLYTLRGLLNTPTTVIPDVDIYGKALGRRDGLRLQAGNEPSGTRPALNYSYVPVLGWQGGLLVDEEAELMG
jgi:hypothetical protein